MRGSKRSGWQRGERGEALRKRVARGDVAVGDDDGPKQHGNRTIFTFFYTRAVAIVSFFLLLRLLFIRAVHGLSLLTLSLWLIPIF